VNDPVAIHYALKSYEDGLRREGLKASSVSPWLTFELRKPSLPTLVVHAMHMKTAVGAIRNKTDRNDVCRIASLMRTGWFREVHVKSAACHRMRILLASRRLMTVPEVGSVTALAFTSVIDDPRRFRRWKMVGAYFGLTSRRYQSGTVDCDGRLSKCGDPEVYTLLYEAASSLLLSVKKWSALKAWGMAIRQRSGLRRAIVAVVRKLAVIRHCIWIDSTEFQFSQPKIAPAEA